MEATLFRVYIQDPQIPSREPRHHGRVLASLKFNGYAKNIEGGVVHDITMTGEDHNTIYIGHISTYKPGMLMSLLDNDPQVSGYEIKSLATKSRGKMYTIVELGNDDYRCECEVQDGTECWITQGRQAAVHALIRAARALNGSYIREDDIKFIVPTPAPAIPVNKADLDLLDLIRRKEVVVLPHDDPRVSMRITPQECDTIRRIREGEARIVDY